MSARFHGSLQHKYTHKHNHKHKKMTDHDCDCTDHKNLYDCVFWRFHYDKKALYDYDYDQ